MRYQSREFSDASNCRRAARQHLEKADAKPDLDYFVKPIVGVGGVRRFRFEIPDLPARAPAKAVAVQAAPIVAPVAAASPPADGGIYVDPFGVLFATESEALLAARLKLGHDAVNGKDFVIIKTKRGDWLWRTGEADRLSKQIAISKAASVETSAAARRRPVRTSKAYAEALAAAEKGKMPSPPDFSAETHRRYRPRLADLVKMAKAGDVAGLRAYPIKPSSTSPKALDRYRNLAVIALEAKAK